MTKLQIKSDRITSFGGIYLVNRLFDHFSLGKVINDTLGLRSTAYNGYQWDEIVKSLFDIYLCGGDHIEDITSLMHCLSQAPGSHVPSSGTIGRGIKQLATDNITYTAKSGQFLDVDFDHQFIPTKKHDATYSYKKAFGYFPGVASVGGVIVHVENRDGNTPVKFCQAETLKRLFASLRKHELFIYRFRADCGSYSKEIVETIDAHSNLFYRRASNCESAYTEFAELDGWKTIEINYQKCEVRSVKFNWFMEEKGYRLVIQRTRIEHEPDIFGDTFSYVYRCILTNDWEMSEKVIIEYYNQRGARERDFDAPNNDFGWSHLPCSFLNENTVFLLLMAMCKNFHTAILYEIGKVFYNIKPKHRLKKFIYRFISVPAKWVRTARTHVLRLFTDRPYDRLNLF
nr:IS1380 family transposase [uncultured Prevotella sp.]